MFNSYKSGLESIDKETINKKIEEISAGSKFYENQKKKEKQTNERIQGLVKKKESVSQKDYLFAKPIVEGIIKKLEDERELSKTFVHIDMDAVEMRDNPEYQSVPMAVGHDVLCTANYEARKFGVVSAMPGYIAKKLCPSLILLPTDIKKYAAESEKVREIIKDYDPDFSSFSLDEASLDLTNYLKRVPNMTAEEVTAEIRSKIYEKTKLTCSAGIACNKLLAKIGSNKNKPNGQFYLPSDKSKIMEFMSELPARKINGIGKVMGCIMKGTLQIIDQAVWIYLLFSEIQFKFLIESALGIGSTSINQDYTRKSMSIDRTVLNLSNPEEIFNLLRTLADHLAEDMKAENIQGKTIGIKYKTVNFDVFTRAKTLHNFIFTADDLYKYAKQLIEKELPLDLRLLGIRISGLEEKNIEEGLLKHVKKEVPKSKEYVVCPICLSHIYSANEAEINSHVDDCLAFKMVDESKPDKIQLPGNKKKVTTLDSFLKKKL